jgi:hypothetical protein
MEGTSRVAVVGRSIPDLAAVWSGLQPYFRSADLIVSACPAERALEGPTGSESAVFAVIDRQDDLDELLSLDVSPGWLVVLCPSDLMQSALAELKPLPLVVLPLEDAALALAARGASSWPPGHPSPRERQV